MIFPPTDHKFGLRPITDVFTRTSDKTANQTEMSLAIPGNVDNGEAAAATKLTNDISSLVLNIAGRNEE
jgi:hypothetical protein